MDSPSSLSTSILQDSSINGDDKAKHCTRSTQDSFLSTLNAMRTERLFCDVTILLQNMEFPAHRAVLAATSRYFYALLSDDFRETRQDTIEMQGIKCESFVSILNYMYGEEIVINNANVVDLLMAADMLLLTSLKDECCDYLEDKLCTESCLGIKTLANAFKCTRLLIAADGYIDDHFSEIINTEEWLSLSYENVKDVLFRQASKHVPQETLYERVIGWLKHDSKNRTQYLGALISSIQFSQLSKEYIKNNIRVEPMIMRNVKCMRLIFDTVLDTLEPTESVPKDEKEEEVPPTGALVILGGDGEAKQTFEYYHFDKKYDFCVYNLPGNIHRAGMVNVDHIVYILGGEEKKRPVKHFFKYDLHCGDWNRSVDMIVARRSHGIVLLNDCIYAIGGWNGKKYLKSVEKFNMKTQQWSLVAEMSSERRSMGVAVLNNCIYVVGGRNFQTAQLKSVERYDPQTNTWTRVSEMKVPRGAVGVGVLNDMLYAIGGWNSGVLNSIEVYNPIKNEWLDGPSMNIAREGIAVVAANNSVLYVIGGSRLGGQEDSIEVFDPKQHQWAILPTKMNTKRAFHCAMYVTLED